MKSKSLRLLFSLCLMLVVLPSITTHAQDLIKLKIGYSVWVRIHLVDRAAKTE